MALNRFAIAAAVGRPGAVCPEISGATVSNMLRQCIRRTHHERATSLKTKIIRSRKRGHMLRARTGSS